MENDIKNKESRNILRIESDYTTMIHELDVNNCIQIKNKEKNIVEYFTISQMIKYFYENTNDKEYGINRVFIWSIDEKKIIKEITDLPNTKIKEINKNKKTNKFISEILILINKFKKFINGK
jgi:hypothetical protein